MKDRRVFEVYLLNKNYYDYLFNQNKLTQMLQKLERPYVGFVEIEINGMDYAIPLWSDNENKYKLHHKYSILIPDENGNKLGVLLINKMIPIINNKNSDLFLEKIDFYKSSNDFILRTVEELNFLNQTRIYNQVINKANEIYNLRYDMSDSDIANCTNNDIKFAVDFKKAEELMYEYAKLNHIPYKRQKLEFSSENTTKLTLDNGQKTPVK